MIDDKAKSRAVEEAVRLPTHLNSRFALYREQDPTFRQNEVEFWATALDRYAKAAADLARKQICGEMSDPVLAHWSRAIESELAKRERLFDFSKPIFSEMRSLRAEVQRLREEADRWQSVSDGTIHDPRCKPPGFVCLRCQGVSLELWMHNMRLQSDRRVSEERERSWRGGWDACEKLHIDDIDAGPQAPGRDDYLREWLDGTYVERARAQEAKEP